MKFDGVALYVSVANHEAEEVASGNIVFNLERYIVPQFFGELTVGSSPATEFFHRRQKIALPDLPSVLRPYFERPLEYPGQSPEEKLMQDIETSPYMEGLWIRVWGEVRIEPHTEGDAVIERGEKARRKGDMDLPIRGYMPWDFWVDATKIELDIRPQLVELTKKQLGEEDSE